MLVDLDKNVRPVSLDGRDILQQNRVLVHAMKGATALQPRFTTALAIAGALDSSALLVRVRRLSHKLGFTLSAAQRHVALGRGFVRPAITANRGTRHVYIPAF